MADDGRYVTKVTAKGQVTIPKEIRDRLGLEEGAHVVWTRGEGRAVLERAAVAPTGDFDALAERIAERFADRGISREDVKDAIRWARDPS
ncbi:MAG: AbrB/MazE/SpoVT family DNA-binding domain-containing protein [Candidatus Palauibacterales bacterium]|nr:AbrB/MazE/SpoVT family DNA-binding domain-containing protein [Candidatus Palauibacterales bacterium]